MEILDLKELKSLAQPALTLSAVYTDYDMMVDLDRVISNTIGKDSIDKVNQFLKDNNVHAFIDGVLNPVKGFNGLKFEIGDYYYQFTCFVRLDIKLYKVR